MVSKQKILIVDDDVNIAELISLYLTKDTRTEGIWARYASSRYLSSKATASSVVFPIRLISAEMEADLDIFSLQFGEGDSGVTIVTFK